MPHFLGVGLNRAACVKAARDPSRVVNPARNETIVHGNFCLRMHSRSNPRRSRLSGSPRISQHVRGESDSHESRSLPYDTRCTCVHRVGSGSPPAIF